MNRLTCSSSPLSRPSRHDGRDEASQRRQHRHVSVPGLHGNVHVLGALRRVESAAPALLLVPWTRHPGTSDGPTDGIVHGQNHRHGLVCNISHFEVMVRLTKGPLCPLAGEYIPCTLSGVDHGGLTTCVAKCLCDGKDCKHATIHIPEMHEDWEICEITVE